MDITIKYSHFESLNKSILQIGDEARKYAQENARLKAEVERLEKEVWRMKVFKGIDEDTKTTLKDALNTVPEWAKVLETIENNAQLKTENISLKAEVERLTKAVMHSPAAQLKLKELEGKTTFDEINPKEVRP